MLVAVVVERESVVAALEAPPLAPQCSDAQSGRARLKPAAEGGRAEEQREVVQQRASCVVSSSGTIAAPLGPFAGQLIHRPAEGGRVGAVVAAVKGASALPADYSLLRLSQRL